MPAHDIGDPVRLTFTTTVDGTATDPSDLTLTVTKPDGTTDAFGMGELDKLSVGSFRKDYSPATAGTYGFRWVATGTAAAVEEGAFDVRPAASTKAGYASTLDLATFTGQPAPPDAYRQLRRASEVIDELLLTAVYAVDANGQPTDAAVAAALRDATCAQVEFWMTGDEEDDIAGPLQGVVLGGMQLQYGAGDNRITPTHYAPRAVRILLNAGLLNPGVAAL